MDDPGDIDDVFVAQLMSTDPATVSPETLVETAADLMLDEAVGSVVVVDGGNHLEGILTRTDFVAIVAGQEPKDETPVSAYMSAEPYTAAAGEPIQAVADRMVDHGVHHMPVVEDDGTVIGMLTTAALTKYLSTVQTAAP